jgi:hypothetical protein
MNHSSPYQGLKYSSLYQDMYFLDDHLLIPAMKKHNFEDFLTIDDLSDNAITRAMQHNNYKFMKCFFEAFKNDFNGDFPIDRMYTRHITNFRELFLTYALSDHNRKHYIDLYINHPNFLPLKDGKIPLNKQYSHFTSSFINLSFSGEYSNLCLHYFNEINKDYADNFIDFLGITKNSHQAFLTGLNFYNLTKKEILNKIEINENADLFNNFFNKEYLNIINKDPSCLIKVSSNIDNTKSILSLIKDKDDYLNTLYKNRNKKHYKQKEKGLSNSKAPIAYAVVMNNSDFINLMIDYGYQLNDDEKIFIKQYRMEDKIKGFSDNFTDSMLSLLSGEKTENDKIKKLISLNQNKKIVDQDFYNILQHLDFSKIDQTHYLIKHLNNNNEEQMYKKYQNNEASAIDYLLIKISPAALLSLKNINFSNLQKLYLLRKTNRYLNSMAPAKDFDSCLKDIQNIEPFFISQVYESCYLADSPRKIQFWCDFKMAQSISKEEILENKDLFLIQSGNMYAKYISYGFELSDQEMIYLSKLLYNNTIDILSTSGTEENGFNLLKIFSANLSIINNKYPEIINNYHNLLKTETGAQRYDKQTSFIENQLLLNSLSHKNETLIPQKKNRL